MNHGLPEAALEKIRAVFLRYPEIEQAILYGSRAKGTYRPGSDIDIVLRGGTGLDLAALKRIMNDVDDLLLPYSVDLSVLSDLKEPALLEHIERVGVPVYEKRPDKK